MGNHVAISAEYLTTERIHSGLVVGTSDDEPDPNAKWELRFSVKTTAWSLEAWARPGFEYEVRLVPGREIESLSLHAVDMIGMGTGNTKRFVLCQNPPDRFGAAARFVVKDLTISQLHMTAKALEQGRVVLPTVLYVM